jgi:predicted RNA-binding protein YlxR (DUF448 family)
LRTPDGTGPSRTSVRTCIVTRQALPASGLIRFVASPEGVVTPDLKHKLPGRGVWVTAAAGTVAEAVRRNAFGRALKATVTTPADLADLVDRLLVREALQALALANKAGAVTCGAAKIEGGPARRYAALVHARDASPQGVEKLERAVRSARRDSPAIPSIRLFGSDELSLSLGREHVIHAALVAGGPAQNFLGKALAADRYRRTEPATMPLPDHDPAEASPHALKAKE